MQNLIRDWIDNWDHVNSCDQEGNYLIENIVGIGNPKLLSQAIELGINVNQQLFEGWPPLHWAFDSAIDGMIQSNATAPTPQSLEIIRLLLKSGADLSRVDRKNKTALSSLKTYSGNIENFNSLKDMFRPIISDIDSRVSF